MNRFVLPLVAALSLSACVTAPPIGLPDAPEQSTSGTDEAGASATTVYDEPAKQRLLNADGITLQWIGWDQRGEVFVREEGGQVLLTGSQGDPSSDARLYVDGKVTEIGAEYFVLDGKIRIENAPDAGRMCEMDKVWQFAVTQDRPYWRLREFEWCDDLTDYVDVYF